MVVMLACVGLLALGTALAWRWRGCAVDLPGWSDTGPGGASRLRLLVRLLGVAVLTGLLVGLLVVGPAARLAMRLLAAASTRESQGLITDAGEVVGEISLNGTLALFTFVGLPFGMVVGLLYALTSFALPRRVLGGAVFGAGLLVLVGATVDPLRPENPDFDILEPGWLAVLTFVSMAVLTGAVTAPIAGRIGIALSTPRVWWAIWAVPIGVVVLVATVGSAPSVGLLGLAGGAVIVAALATAPGRRPLVWRRGRRALQVLLAVAVLLATPSFLGAVVDIV